MIFEMSQISHELHYIIFIMRIWTVQLYTKKHLPPFGESSPTLFSTTFVVLRTQAELRAAAPTWPAGAMTRRCCAFGGGSAKPERGDLKCLIGMEPGLGWLALGVT